MGAVFEAEHAVMGKRVAIKWILPGLSLKARATDRLVQEARAVARVRHPNVVDVYDVGREDGAVYLVMEYLEGEPLAVMMERGGIPMHRFIALLLPAMRGVAAAHRQGVIHRDIKPDNIYLARGQDGDAPLPKVLDFGISKLDARGDKQPSLTLSGGTVGTPMYMSYEQLRGSREVDGRTDVYAFGVILYEALTGHLPHEADSYPALIVKVTTETAVPARERNPDVPLELDRIIAWALAREPQDRIESVDALIRELEPFATETGFRADMKTAEIPCTPAPSERTQTREGSRATRSSKATSALRSSKPVSAAAQRRWMLTVAGAVALAVGLALAWPRSQPRAAVAPPVIPVATPAAIAPAPALSVQAPVVVVPSPPQPEASPKIAPQSGTTPVKGPKKPRPQVNVPIVPLAVKTETPSADTTPQKGRIEIPKPEEFY